MRIAKIPVVGDQSVVAIPEDATFFLMYRLSTDLIVYGKISDGTSFPITSTSGTLIALMGTMGFADVNAGPVAATFVFNMPSALLANSIFKGFYTKTIAPFVSATRDIATGRIKNGAGTNIVLNNGTIPAGAFSTLNEVVHAIYGQAFPEISGPADNASFTLDFAAAGNNPQDYTTGSMKIYLEYAPYPTLP